MVMLFNSHPVCDTKDAWTIPPMCRILIDIKKYGSKSLSFKMGWRLHK